MADDRIDVVFGTASHGHWRRFDMPVVGERKFKIVDGR
jgi:hypothetical protein